MALEEVPFAVLVADNEMRLQDATEAACRLLGYPREELIRLSVADIVAEFEPATALFAEYLAAGEQHGRIVLRRKDGTTVAAGYTAHVLRAADANYNVSILIPETSRVGRLGSGRGV